VGRSVVPCFGVVTHVPHSNGASSSPFLDLPREIRDQIYHLALQIRVDFVLETVIRSFDEDNPQEVEDENDTKYFGKLSYKLIPTTPVNGASILLVNRQVSDEAQQVPSNLRNIIEKHIIRDGRQIMSRPSR